MLGLSLALSCEQLVPLLVWVYLSCSPAWFIFVSLFVAVEELTFPFWLRCHTYDSRAYPSLPRRFHFADDISKPPALPFSDTKIYLK